MILYTTASTDSDLHGILQLQQQNLTQALSVEERQSQGFVTVVHSFANLQQMNNIEKHVIAKDGEKVIAYLLAMTVQSKEDIPVLQPMFDLFSYIPFAGKALADYRYLVVGQVCVDKAYRGKGIFDKCYAFYKETYRGKYDFVITEIAATNQRSLAAHNRIGFQEFHRSESAGDTEWVIVLWNWNNVSQARLSTL